MASLIHDKVDRAASLLANRSRLISSTLQSMLPFVCLGIKRSLFVTCAINVVRNYEEINGELKPVKLPSGLG